MKVSGGELSVIFYVSYIIFLSLYGWITLIICSTDLNFKEQNKLPCGVRKQFKQTNKPCPSSLSQL